MIAGNTAESGESTPVSVGSEKCTFEDFPPEISETMDTTIIGDVADEEKTLTAYMREEMSRPRLAEIRWTKSDDPVQVLSLLNILFPVAICIEEPRVGGRQSVQPDKVLLKESRSVANTTDHSNHQQ